MTRGRAKLLEFYREILGDDFGHREPRWEKATEAWGSIRPATGRELVDGEQTTPMFTHVVETEWSEEIKAKQEMRYRKRVFGVVSVLNNDERSRTMKLGVLERESA